MGAFDMLEQPLASAGSGPEASKLIAYFAQEMQLFFQHIQAATVQFNESGEVPTSLFKTKQVNSLGKAAGGKRKKSKRAPSAFNMYMADKLKEYKEKGVKAEGEGRNPLFSMAASEWKSLSKEQKAAAQAKYAPRIAAMKEGGEHVAVEGEHAAAAPEESEEGASSEEEESESEDEESGSDEESEEEAPPPPPTSQVKNSHSKKKPKH